MTDRPFADDPHRPRYHFLPPANWMNDPNGLIHYKGLYHLFYQHNPFGALWGNMHWGHATSPDLVHWTHMPIALAPDPDGPDADGCYSGVTVVHDGVPTIVYTGVRGPHELACLATSADDELATWTKHPGNPVIPGTPEGVPTTISRDHTLWREGDAWLMGVGAGIEGQGGAVLLYRSSDLVEWDYLHPLVTEVADLNPQGKIISTGWECPDVFFLDNQPVFVACDWDGDPLSVSYWTGTYADRLFIPQRHGVVDAGKCFYAPQSFADASGRRVMIGWLRERREDEALVAAGWAGAMTLPRTVTMLDDGALAFAPVREVELLRGEHRRFDLRTGSLDLDGIPGDTCEILVRTDTAPVSPIEIEVLRADDGSERAVIRFDPATRTLTLDTTNASLSGLAFGDIAMADVPERADGGCEIRIFVDRSIVEVWVDGRTCLSGRAYPTSGASGVRVINDGATPGHVDLWEMHDAVH